jgi:CRISPR-associated protein Csb2
MCRPTRGLSFDLRNAARQLKSEIGTRGLPAQLAAKPLAVAELEVRGREPLQAGEFHLESYDGAKPPEGSAPCFFRLEFKAPVSGPLAFGWACHRGLGQFAAAEG